MADKRAKCSISEDGWHVEPCDMLAHECEFGSPRPKVRGIFCWAMRNLKTGKASRTFFGVVSTSSPKGMVFNFCPFCGTAIDEPMLEKEPQA